MSRPKPRHTAFVLTYWANLYPDGRFSGYLYINKDHAIQDSTSSDSMPDAEQVEVRLVEVKPKKT